VGKQADVTVIVATRNRAAYLDVALASLVAQQCDVNFEVLVVDNGSTDATPALLERWGRDDQRVRVVREARPGLSRAKNAGVAAAKGRALLFTDDDVVVSERWLASLVEALESHQAELVVVGGKILPVPHDLGPWPAWFDDVALPDAGLLDLSDREPVVAPQYVWGANMAVRSELFERLGPWDETVGRRGDERGTFEDTELQDRVRAAGGSVWFCPGAVLRHRVERAAVTRREMVLRAFARGGYDRRIDQLRTTVHPPEPPVPLLAGAALASVANLVVWELAFRALRTRRVFARLHRAAWRTGQRLEPLEARGRARPGGEQLAAKIVRRAVWASRRLIVDRG
jgi:GT2 family glycosyltransferase